MFDKKNKKKSNNQNGSIIMLTIIFTSLFIGIMGGVFILFVYQSRLSKKLQAKEVAIQIAEGGINYYRWHLAHAEEDYADGTGDSCTYPTPCGPYHHDYNDPLGGKIGTFELYITPPPVGSTIVTIKSTGWVEGYTNQARIVEVKYGIPSLSQYAVLANNYIGFGSGTNIYGPLHANNGIRFNGTAYNLVTSGIAEVDDPDHDPGLMEYGVHTHMTPADPFNPLPPPPPPSRSDIFLAGREFPVTAIDFNGISADLSLLLGEAENDVNCDIDNGGCVIDDSGVSGWQIELLGDGTFRYRTVNSTNTCTYWYGGIVTVDEGDVGSSGTWTTLSLPDRGVIFVHDNVWINGVINNNRVTVVAAEEPIASGNSKIWINNDLTYTNSDGTDAIGLIAQDDISVGLFSEDDLDIDAALISQNGRIGRELYPWFCEATQTFWQRNTITIYGSLSTNERYVLAWGCGGSCWSGYWTRNLTYDNNLTFGPPPSFPTTGEYTFISWEEKLPGE